MQGRSPLLECCPSASLKLLPRNHQSDHARIICAGLDLQICAKRCLAGCTFASFDKRQPQSAMCLCKCRVETDRAAIELHRVHQIALIAAGAIELASCKPDRKSTRLNSSHY